MSFFKQELRRKEVVKREKLKKVTIPAKPGKGAKWTESEINEIYESASLAFRTGEEMIFKKKGKFANMTRGDLENTIRAILKGTRGVEPVSEDHKRKLKMKFYDKIDALMSID